MSKHNTTLDELRHMEKVHDDYFETLDKISTEDKFYMSREESLLELAPWEISEIVKNCLGNLPEGTKEYTDKIFDVVYEAIAEALAKSRGFVK